jgi:hypothetical protein
VARQPQGGASWPQIQTKTLLQVLRHYGKEEKKGRKKRKVKKGKLMVGWPPFLPAGQPTPPNHLPLCLQFKLVPWMPLQKIKNKKHFSFFLFELFYFFLKMFLFYEIQGDKNQICSG